MGDMTVIHLPALYSLLYLLWPLCVSYSLAQVWSKERVKERRNSSHAVPGTDVVLFPWESLRTCPLYHSVKKQFGLLPGTVVPLCLIWPGKRQTAEKRHSTLLTISRRFQSAMSGCFRIPKYSIRGRDAERAHDHHKRYVYVTNPP